MAVGAGTIAPAIRWFNAISFRCHKGGKWNRRDDLSVEGYWVKWLVEGQEKFLPFSIRARSCRKIAHISRNWILDVLIGIQTAIVIASKIICLITVVTACRFGRILSFFNCTRLRRKLRPIGSAFRGTGRETLACLYPNLSDFVLHLDGEEAMVHMIMRKGCEATEHWIRKGREHQPTNLIELLKKSTVSQGFKGVCKFDNDHIPSIGSEKPSNCWALPVVTLTSIAVALPNIDHKRIQSFLCGVNEGLRYVRLIEKNLDREGLINVREAADIAWLGVDLHYRWLGEDLRKITLEEKCAKTTIQKLVEIGKKHVLDFATRCGKEKKPLEWPPKILAANSMYRIGQTILQDYNNKLETDGILLEWLQATIADILAACLTNLPRVISMESTCSPIEEREERVRKAVYLLGEAENILIKLGQHAFPDLDPIRMASIDEWRLSKQKDPSWLPCRVVQC